MSYEKMMMEHADRMFDAVFGKTDAPKTPTLENCTFENCTFENCTFENCTSTYDMPMPAKSKQTLAFEALQADAGAMYDVLGMIVDKFDDGRLKDCTVRHNGTQVWLIDELARELVERHEVKS